jgi:hypothetical protein
VARVSATLLGCGSQANRPVPQPGRAVARIEALCRSAKSKLPAAYRRDLLNDPSLGIAPKLEAAARVSAAVVAATASEIESIKVAPYWEPGVERALHDLLYHHAQLLQFEREVRQKVKISAFLYRGWISYFVERDLACGKLSPAAAPQASTSSFSSHMSTEARVPGVSEVSIAAITFAPVLMSSAVA